MTTRLSDFGSSQQTVLLIGSDVDFGVRYTYNRANNGLVRGGVDHGTWIWSGLLTASDNRKKSTSQLLKKGKLIDVSSNFIEQLIELRPPSSDLSSTNISGFHFAMGTRPIG
ncbi:hypothetical protein [Parapedobacter sp. 2B3]|uniref:hypothetical protein n=1 Tax=Parapedobacter sp. 2B3 TaxID=3342381 RepID=UPI0035B5B4A9